MADTFNQELTTNISKILKDDKVQLVKDAVNTYMGINDSVSGQEFFEKFVLASPKDYPTDDSKFYQAVRELKSRLSRVYDDTVALQKLELEAELLVLNIQEYDEPPTPSELDIKRNALKSQMAKIDFTHKKAQIEFAKERLAALIREVEDFKNIADKYKDKVKPYEAARVEEMTKKKAARYVNFVTGGPPLTPSEMALFYQENGLVIAPPEAIDELKKLGFNELANHEQQKIALHERYKQNLIADETDQQEIPGIELVRP